jgi:putative membrane protein
LGLFSFVINAILFWFVASFVDGFTVAGFWVALIGSLLMTVVNMIGSTWIK